MMLSGLINMDEKATVPVGRIRADGGTQMRAGLDETTVKEYAEEMKNGWGDFPPVVLYHDGESYWLADGFHRLAAFRSLAVTSDALIPADVRSGTRRDAILHAARANAAHGLRRTNADKRRAVEVLLQDEEWMTWSDAEIARRCEVSQPFVSNLRKQISASYNDYKMPAERTVQRGGTVYTQNTANIGAQKPLRHNYGLPPLNLPPPPVMDGGPLPGWVNGAPDTAGNAPLTATDVEALASAPETRMVAMSRLINIYSQTIVSFDEYGSLTGAYTETLAAQRGLETLIRRLSREIAMLNGEMVE